MPKNVTFDDGNTIEWLYDAGGNKLSKKTHQNNAASDNLIYYLGGIEYVATTGTTPTLAIDAIYHNEGRCANFTYNTNNAVNGYRYEYSLRDHLGNTRVTFADKNNNNFVDPSEILQQNHYYPFGLNQEGTWNSGPNKYQYNGKELNTDFQLEWNDYGARMYDAAVGRWWAVDRMAGKYRSWSPYNYTKCNPILFTDPDGMGVDGWIERKGELVHDKTVHSQADADKTKEGGKYVGEQVIRMTEDGTQMSYNNNGTTTESVILPWTVIKDKADVKSAPENNTAESFDKANTVVGGQFAHYEHLLAGAAKASPAGLKGVSTLAKVIPGVSLASGVIGAGVSLYQLYQKPTSGNLAKAAFDVAMAAPKIIPIVGVVDAVLDLTGVKDWAFDQITVATDALGKGVDAAVDKIDENQANKVIYQH